MAEPLKSTDKSVSNLRTSETKEQSPGLEVSSEAVANAKAKNGGIVDDYNNEEVSDKLNTETSSSNLNSIRRSKSIRTAEGVEKVILLNEVLNDKAKSADSIKIRGYSNENVSAMLTRSAKSSISRKPTLDSFQERDDEVEQGLSSTLNAKKSAKSAGSLKVQMSIEDGTKKSISTSDNLLSRTSFHSSAKAALSTGVMNEVGSPSLGSLFIDYSDAGRANPATELLNKTIPAESVEVKVGNKSLNVDKIIARPSFRSSLKPKIMAGFAELEAENGDSNEPKQATEEMLSLNLVNLISEVSIGGSKRNLGSGKTPQVNAEYGSALKSDKHGSNEGHEVQMGSRRSLRSLLPPKVTIGLKEDGFLHEIIVKD